MPAGWFVPRIVLAIGVVLGAIAGSPLARNSVTNDVASDPFGSSTTSVRPETSVSHFNGAASPSKASSAPIQVGALELGSGSIPLVCHLASPPPIVPEAPPSNPPPPSEPPPPPSESPSPPPTDSPPPPTSPPTATPTQPPPPPDTTPPDITAAFFEPDIIYKCPDLRQPVDITFSATVRDTGGSGVARVALTITDSDGRLIGEWPMGFSGLGPDQYTLTLNQKEFANGDYYNWRIVATDRAENVSRTYFGDKRFQVVDQCAIIG